MSSTDKKKDDAIKKPDVEADKDKAEEVDGEELRFSPEEEQVCWIYLPCISIYMDISRHMPATSLNYSYLSSSSSSAFSLYTARYHHLTSPGPSRRIHHCQGRSQRPICFQRVSKRSRQVRRCNHLLSKVSILPTSCRIQQHCCLSSQA